MNGEPAGASETRNKAREQSVEQGSETRLGNGPLERNAWLRVKHGNVQASRVERELGQGAG
jgi:hypothetical protein